MLAASWRHTHESQTKLFEYDATKLTPRMAQFKNMEQSSPWRSRDRAQRVLDSGNYSNYEERIFQK